MGYYINVQAKSGCANQINELWKKAGHKPDLIWTQPRIEREIAAIHANPDRAHLRYIQSVEAWNKSFPIMAMDWGQVFIGSVGFDANEDPEHTRSLIEQVQFVLDNRFLFESVTGLEDARTALGMTGVEGDFLDAHGKPGYYEVPSFEKLPRAPSSALYQNCVEADRPDLWQAWLAFAETPNEETWSMLRSKSVPWLTRYSGGFNTVWQLCERAATQRDGKDFGLMGRYRDGVVPLEFEVRHAIAKVDKPAAENEL